MKTRKIESFNYKAEIMFPLQGTDPNKNPKHLKYEKWCWTHHSVVHPLKSEISLAVRQLPELLQAHTAVTRLQRYLLVSNLKARYLSVLIGMNPEKSNQSIHQEKKKKIEEETSFSNLVTVLEYSLELAALNIALNQRPLDLQQILIC